MVHQIVAAAEENIPVSLTRISPLTAESLARLSTELAGARGWSPQTAERTIRIWATALGLHDPEVRSWPQAAVAARPRADAPARPPLEPTAVPSTPPRSPIAPAPADGFSPMAVSGHVEWPTPVKGVAVHTHAKSGEPALGAAMAYAGMPLLLVVSLIVALTVVLLIPVVFLDVMGPLLPLIGFGLASLLMRRLGPGVLVATESGVEFTPYGGLTRKERPQHTFGAGWRDVSVQPGYVSRIRFGGRTVQVGPRNRRFAEAVASRAEARS